MEICQELNLVHMARLTYPAGELQALYTPCAAKLRSGVKHISRLTSNIAINQVPFLCLHH